MGAATIVTSSNFENEVLKADKPVLVDFWAEWCGPCRMLLPVIEGLAVELQGKVHICKVNVDESPDLAGQYDVMSIPTLIIFKGGQAVDTVIGAVAKETILAKLKAQM